SATGDFAFLITGSAAAANGRIYFMTAEEMYCIGTKDAKPAAAAAGPKTAQIKPPGDPQPAQLQIVPADVTLAPGQSIKLTAMLYDANGYYLGEAKPQWSLAAMTPPPPLPNAPPPPKDAPTPPAPPVLKGTISEEGELSVD